VSDALASLLARGATGYRWVAATVDANNAASDQLAAGQPVMAIGGFNGTDPAPTLAQFTRDVARHEIHYFLASGGGSGGGPGSAGGAASSITTWVAAHLTGRTVDGMTVYDLTAP